MNCNLKWQHTDERWTARNSKAIRQANAGSPAPGECIGQIAPMRNAPHVNAGNGKADVNGNTISTD